MKSVLISIQPKFVEKICSGEKTIEVRKTRPKLETQFKCYIYCTIGNGVKGDYLVPSGIQCGKVIGEFVCDRIYEWKYLPDHMDENEYEYYIECVDGHATCLTYDEIYNYGNGKTLYGWHISDLKIYDNPKELSEFYRPCPEYYSDYYNGVCAGMYVFYEEGFCKNFCLPIIRPPQSWCYVESLGE